MSFSRLASEIVIPFEQANPHSRQPSLRRIEQKAPRNPFAIKPPLRRAR
jgi:hypothetical protein